MTTSSTADTGGGMALSPPERDLLLRAARAAVAYALTHGRVPTWTELGVAPTPALLTDAAVFVTLTRPDGSLRGCIGELRAHEPLITSVIQHAIQAATADPRFVPVTPAELPDLTVSISVLSTPHAIAAPEAIVLGRHGVILTKDRHRAVFLPQVATEQGWDVPTLLAQLARKAGLSTRDGWHGADLQVFEATVFGEPEGGVPPCRGST